MALTELESEVVQGSTAAAAVVSALANVALLAHARSWRGSGAGDPERFPLRTVFFIAATNLGQCVGFALGNAPVRWAGDAGCIAQALLLQLCGLSTVLWTLVLAHGLWRSACRGDGAQALARREGRATAAALGLPLLSCVLLLANGDLGEEEDEHVRDQWCWIGVQGGSARTDGVLRFVALYLWVVLGWIYAAFVFVDVTRTLHQRAASVSLGQRQTAMAMAQEATQQLRALVGIFIAVWAGGLVARGYEATVGEESFALTLWQCATLPLAGVLNAATLLLPQYLRGRGAQLGSGAGLQGSLLGGAAGGGTDMPLEPASELPTFNSQPQQSADGIVRPEPRPLSPERSLTLTVDDGNVEAGGGGGPQESSLCVVTWNLGEGKLSSPDQLTPLLLPAGEAADVYLISLQECVDVETWVQLALQCLQQNAPPPHNAAPYTSFVEKIGSSATFLGYHGFIAIVVLASPTLEASDSFSLLGRGRQLKTGKALPGGLGKLSNKGGVGLSFRLHSSTFAGVGCHLQSDSGGGGGAGAAMKSKLAKRNEQVRAMMSSLELNNLSGVEGVDFCQLFHHTFFLGDLNYRLSDGISLDATIDGIAAADWPALLRADELGAQREAGAVFDGWGELPVAFRPSYRRRRRVPAPGAFASADTLRSECYTINSGQPDDTVKTRKPSYCDRVLVHSLDGLEAELAPVSYSALEASECEAVALSDHVPVIARFTVRSEPHSAIPSPVPGARRSQILLRLSGMGFEPTEAVHEAGGAALPAGPLPTTLGVVYPLPSEDELAPIRSITPWSGGFSPTGAVRTHSGGDGAGGSSPGAGGDGSVEWAAVASESGEVVLRIEPDGVGAWRRQHVLLCLDGEGGTVGHAVLSLAQVAAVSAEAPLPLSIAVRWASLRRGTMRGFAHVVPA